ncbi:MAG: hypothetical protein JO072_01130 [Parafilimonas sp.]|nr:hypothetical protein [Parafilimonas sp.]
MEQQQVQEIIQEQEIKQKTSRLRMLFKIAFICNLFFIVCMLMRYTTVPNHLPQFIIELSLLLGWPAMFINLLSFVLALILISRIKKRQVPLWLLYINIIFFLIQFYFFFILHD